MLQYDLAHFSIAQSGGSGKHKTAVEKAKQLLEEKPYEVIPLEDMKMVRIDSHTCQPFQSNYSILYSGNVCTIFNLFRRFYFQKWK